MPKFAVGQRIKMIRKDHPTIGQVGTIVKCCGTSKSAMYDSNEDMYVIKLDVGTPDGLSVWDIFESDVKAALPPVILTFEVTECNA